MSTLAEIEAAAAALPIEEKHELLMFLAQKVRAESASLPLPRNFPVDQVANWIATDEVDMQRFRRGRSESFSISAC